MGGIVKGVKTLISGPEQVKPQIASKGYFDISKEVKPAQEDYANLLAGSKANQAAVAPAQTDVLKQMGEAALGRGPSLAEAQLKAAQDRNLAQQLAAIQAQRGGSAAANSRALLQNMGQSGRDLAQQAAQARLQERDNFLNQANLAGQTVRSDIGQKVNLDLMPKQSLQNWELGRVQAVNAAQAQNAQANNALAGALIGGAASIGAAAAGKPPVAAAKGGYIKGPGTPTSDSIPAKLSDGEFVIKAAAVSKPGVKKALEKLNSNPEKYSKAFVDALLKGHNKKK